MRYLALLLAFFIPLSACAEDSAKPAEEKFKLGQHYTVISPAVRTATPGKIEVAEVFWYGCSHCFSFEPSLAAWEKTKPENSELVKVPAIWRDVMRLHAQMFYAVDALGLGEEAHEAIFKAMNTGTKKRLGSEKDIAELFAQFGKTEEEVKAVLNSFAVKAQAQQAESRMKGYGITSTPSMVVNGKYLITPRSAGSHEKMLQVVNFLVAKETK